MEAFSIVLVVIAMFYFLISQGKEEVSSTISIQISSAWINYRREGKKGKRKKGKNNITRAAEGGKWPLCVCKNRRNILNSATHSCILCTLYTEHLYIHTPGHKPNLQLNKSFLAGFALYLICNTKFLHQTPSLPSTRSSKGTCNGLRRKAGLRCVTFDATPLKM